MPGWSAKAGILDHPAERRSGVMIDNRVEFYLGEAYLPENMQEFCQIPLGFFAHAGNLHAIELRRTFGCRSRDRAEALVISTSDHDLFRCASGRI